MEPKIVLIGHVCIDHNTSEHATYTGWGSSVIYMADYLKNTCQLEPVILSSYGFDMLKYLPDIVLLPSKPSNLATLVYENDSRTGRRIQRCRNVDQAVPPVLNVPLKEAIGVADVIIVAPLLDNFTHEYVTELLDYASPQAIKVLCPQGYFRHIGEDGRVTFQDFKDLGAVASLFDLVFYSEEDHPDAFELAEQWSHNSNTQFIVTQAAAGASIVHKDKIINIPTTPIPPEQIIDSVGCGDVFAASATYSYYRSRNLSDAIKSAHNDARQKLLRTTDQSI